MRYLAQFKDGTSKRLSEQEGKATILSWAGGAKIILIRGAAFDRNFISCIKPIAADWLDKETAEKEEPEQMEKLSDVLSNRKQLR